MHSFTRDRFMRGTSPLSKKNSLIKKSVLLQLKTSWAKTTSSFTLDSTLLDFAILFNLHFSVQKFRFLLLLGLHSFPAEGLWRNSLNLFFPHNMNLCRIMGNGKLVPDEKESYSIGLVSKSRPSLPQHRMYCITCTRREGLATVHHAFRCDSRGTILRVYYLCSVVLSMNNVTYKNSCA